MSASRKSASGIRHPASGITIDTGRLVRMRYEKSWERADLAAASGLSPSMIAKIETGERRPRLDKLAAICAALGCSVADLLPELEERRTA
jgi:transcriptional regulator with XRE-family HTH domain